MKVNQSGDKYVLLNGYCKKTKIQKELPYDIAQKTKYRVSKLR